MARPDQYDLTGKRVPVDSLRPHPENPRIGDLDAVADSLERNGQYKPIVTAGDVVLAGNHTWQAAQALGWETVRVVDLGISPYSHEAKRIMLADNRTADLGRYDEALLTEMITALSADDLGGTGYDEADLDELRAALARADNAPLDWGQEDDDKAEPTRPLTLTYGRAQYEEVGAMLDAYRERNDLAEADTTATVLHLVRADA